MACLLVKEKLGFDYKRELHFIIIMCCKYQSEKWSCRLYTTIVEYRPLINAYTAYPIKDVHLVRSIASFAIPSSIHIDICIVSIFLVNCWWVLSSSRYTV